MRKLSQKLITGSEEEKKVSTFFSTERTSYTKYFAKGLMLIFIDFDDVLFNRRVFKEKFFKFFFRFGIEERHVYGTYDRIRRERGFYDFKEHVETLESLHNSFDKKRFFRDFDVFVKRSKNLIFKDAKPFLRFLKNKKHRPVLVSSGDEFLQMSKIKTSGLAGFFEKIIVVKSDYKTTAVKKFFGSKNNPFIFIDDRRITVDDIKDNFKKAFAIQLLRPSSGERGSEKADAIAVNLKQAIKLIKNINA